MQHDFPSHLDELVHRTRGAFGTAQHIAKAQTLLRYFKPFLGLEQCANAVSAMRSPSVAHLKFNLGLLTSRFRAHHPLKACTQCISNDRQETGWSYWHIQHQYPGVRVCPKHGTILFESTLKSGGVSRFDWVLPSALHTAVFPVTPSESAQKKWLSLSETIISLVDTDEAPGWLAIDHLQRVLLREIRLRGWSTHTGQLRIKQIAQDFVPYAANFIGMSELSALPRSVADAEIQIGRLLRPMRTGTHPLRFLTLIDWLFPSASSFRAALADMSADHDASISDKPGILKQPANEANPAKDELIRRIITGEALSTVARDIGVAITTASAWAAQVGIATNRRPSVLKTDVYDALILDLKRGTDKQVAAQNHAVSISTVNRILRTTVGLQSRWTNARFEAAREKHRADWLGGLQLHRTHGVKFLRALLSSGYAWLYRNDRAWLQEQHPSRVSRQSVGPRIHWDSRDHELKLAAQKAILLLAKRRPRRIIRLSEILQLVPDLKAKQNQLDRLPLTSKVLKEAIGDRRGRRDNG